MSGENSFGSLLTSLRLEKKKKKIEAAQWTQQKVAEKLGVSRGLYNSWENDVRLPLADDLKRIAALFKLNDKDRDALYRAAAQVPPEIENLPFQRNPFFTGREEHLERLGKQLQETGTVEITQSISISGLGGIGKTELALEYAHRSHPNVYRVVLWVDADKATLQASYASLAQTLKLEEQNEQELDKRIQAVKDWLKTHTNWLLIMDNADDLPLASSFLPSKPLGHVVFTTQSQIISTIPRQIEIREMQPADGLLLLLRRSHVLKVEATLDTVAADVREAALQVVELLGGHPLALDQAGAYIEETGVSFTDYVNRYHAERPRLLGRRESRVSEYSKHPEPVAVTFKLSFEKACERHPLASDILHFCAFLQPDAIPEELFQHDDSFKFDTTAFDEGIEALRRYSLIKRNRQEQTFSMHRLVQAVLIDAMPPGLQKQWRERVVRALNAAFPELEFFKGWERYERLLPHVLAYAAWTADEMTPTIGTAYSAELFQKAGIYLRTREQYSEAETLLVRLLPIYEQHLGAEHLITASALTDLAHLYYKQCEYEQAEPLYRQAIAIQEKQLGAEHPDTARSLYNLATLYFEQDKDEQAKPLLERTLSIQKKHLGIAHLDTAPTIWSVRRLHKQGKHEQAGALFQQIISNLEQLGGATHPDIQTIRLLYESMLHNNLL